MRIFHGRLRLDKVTEQSARWKKMVDGVPFEFYIFQERIPRPIPRVIEVSIFDHKDLYHRLLMRVGRKSVSELTDSEKSELAMIGLDGTHIRVAGADAIIGAGFRGSVHTKTVRYNAPRKYKELEFGDPYVPQSQLREPYPDRLLFLVRWISDDPGVQVS